MFGSHFSFSCHVLGSHAGPAAVPDAFLDGLRPVTAPFFESLNHMGDGFWDRRRVGEALACYLEAVRRGADPAARAERRWMAWMMLGRFEHAWRESDRLERLHRAHHGPGTHCHTWDGRPLDGRDVLVRCAHGLGDTIQFARYLPLLRARCPSLILQAQRELWPILQGLGADRLVPSWEVLPDDLSFETEIEIMELPYAFRSTPATIPAEVPYLHVPSAGFSSHPEKCLKIGLIWASSSWYAARSVPLELFEPLFRMPGLAIYNLQHGPERDNFPLAIDNQQSAIRNPQFQPSILDTASRMLEMDLILTPDTLTAHLAGALGRPVWVMLLHHADWRWMDARADTPWYPTMRLFRQPAPGDWAGCVHEMFSRLSELIQKK